MVTRAVSLWMVGLVACVACGGSEEKSSSPAVDAGVRDAAQDDAPAGTDAGTDARGDSGLACIRTADCPAGVCCRDVLPLGASGCRKDCFTNAARVQMCAAGEDCQSGNACEAWPTTCTGGLPQMYCESATSYCP